MSSRQKRTIWFCMLCLLAVAVSGNCEASPRETWETWFAAGNEAMNFALFPSAIHSYSKSIELLPQNLSGREVFASRSVAYCMNKKYAESLADAEESLKRSAKPYAYGYYAKGCALRGRQKFSEAIDSLDRAIQFDPQLGWAYWLRSKVYVDQGKFELATVDAERLIKMNPQWFLGYENKAFIYYKQNQWEKAIRWYRKLLEVFPQHLYAYWYIAVSYENMNDTPNAIKAYKEFWNRSGIEDPNAWKAKEKIDEYEERLSNHLGDAVEKSEALYE
jgi:tetratricopeptide (TPR) repeat protein